MEDYHEEQEIESFIEELGVNEIDPDDPGWSTPLSLGSRVHAHLVRQKMAEQ